MTNRLSDNYTIRSQNNTLDLFSVPSIDVIDTITESDNNIDTIVTDNNTIITDNNNIVTDNDIIYAGLGIFISFIIISLTN
jgi:hypothetical protein